MNPDTTQLQAEVQRLNVIINALIEKNIRLEAALLSSQKEKAGGSNPATQPVPHLLDGILPSSLGTLDAGTENSIFYSTIKDVGINDTFSYPSTKHEGITDDVSYPFINDGRINDSVSYAHMKDGRTADTVGGGATSLTRNQLIQVADRLDLDAVYETLKAKGMFRVTNIGVERMAKVLLLLCRNERLPYATIRKQAQMEDTGIYKMLASMKRRGWIIRTGYQTLELTGNAVELLVTAVKRREKTIAQQKTQLTPG